MAEIILKICPSNEELTEGKYYHKRKIGKYGFIPENGEIKTYQYHCPIVRCKYFMDKKSFSSIKFLKQHYRKVHMSKKYICETCKKTFALESYLKNHMDVCGVKFTCSCGAVHNSIEALGVHVKRKNHPNGLTFRDIKMGLKIQSLINRQLKLVYIDVNPKEPYIFNDSTVQRCKETQTSLFSRLPKTNNSHTQTICSNLNNCKKSTSMQTLIPSDEFSSLTFYDNETANSELTKNSSNYGFNSSATQTTPVNNDKVILYNEKDLIDSLSNIKTDFNFDIDIPDNYVSPTHFNSKKLLHSCDPNLGSSQNLPLINDDNNKLCTIETQTEMKNLDGFLGCLFDSDSTFTNYLDSETQTGFDEYFGSSYANTYTQTTQPLFSDMEFVDIETQTPWSFFND